MKSVRWLGVLVLAAGSLMAQDPPAPPSGDAQAAFERLRLVGMGDYMISQKGAPPVSSADLTLAHWAWDQEDPELRARGLSTVLALTRRPWFGTLAEPVRAASVDRAVQFLSDGDSDVRGAATSLVRRLSAAPWCTGIQRRQAASQMLGMLVRPDPDDRRRGALLGASLVRHLDVSMQAEIARTGMMSLDRYPMPEAGAVGAGERASEKDERAATADAMVRHMLTTLVLVEGGLARDVTLRVIEDYDTGRPIGGTWMVSNGAGALAQGLSRWIGGLTGDVREEALGRLLDSLDDRDLLYMTTSGVRSPRFHHGCAAVAFAIPSLQPREVARVRQRFDAALSGWMAAIDDGDRANARRALDAALQAAEAQKAP